MMIYSVNGIFTNFFRRIRVLWLIFIACLQFLYPANCTAFRQNITTKIASNSALVSVNVKAFWRGIFILHLHLLPSFLVAGRYSISPTSIVFLSNW
jgi:hypothetical protein